MYHHKWTSSAGDEADVDGIWAAVLIDVPWVKIKHGFDQLVVKGFKWPPSAPEFRDLCLDVEKGVNVARAPSVEATKERLIGIEQKRTPEQLDKGAQILADLRKGLK